ncbi:glycoside hydrolase family 55 protein [Mycena galopus ATCC 62051]|nr:glycoside hydrolase family 55 protein [Mycena galopus ATCC 62051]
MAQTPGSLSFSLDSGLATSTDAFWLEAINHQGKAAYNADASYQVFRNVKDFGAKGDGITDDTVAINNATSWGNRCGQGCNSSTQVLNSATTPAIVYFPSGTYLVSKAIIGYYYTQFIGNPKNRPTLLAAPTFTDMAVIDADPYIPGGNGAQWYQNQNNFFRSVRNFIIDVTLVPPTAYGTGIHWQVAQATSLMNIEFRMSDAPGSLHQGIYMENGSGGFMGDLVFIGGKFGMWVGNQQFAVRNISISNAQIAVQGVWAWGWSYQGVVIHNCSVGFDLLGGVGAEAIIDAVVTDTPIFIRSATPSNNALVGSLVLTNIELNNVSTAVGIVGGGEVLAGAPNSTMTIESWVQGNIYSGSNSTGVFGQTNIAPPPIDSSLLNANGQIFGKMHPQYADYHVTQFVSVRDHGATGDGKTDDTEAIKAIFFEYGTSKIIFFDAGTYIVTSTITIPCGARVVGEAWSVISGAGTAFQDQDNPQVVVRVGEPGSQGVVEITDIIFSTVGPAPGAIVVEWNVKESKQGSAGVWDTHIRLGGAAGTNLETEQCLPGNDESGCMAAFMALHLTQHSSAYLEGMWVWLADHTLDEDGISMLTIFSGRGILSESQGPVWMIGTAEHHTVYQYQLLNAQKHYIALMQTETPYFQPYSIALPHPFKTCSKYGDPKYPPAVKSAWAVIVQSSTEVVIFGANLYSFYSNYSQTCLDTRNCQDQILNISSDSSVYIYSLATVASTFQISVDGKGVVNQQDNNNGFASTLTVWRPQGSPGKPRHHVNQPRTWF